MATALHGHDNLVYIWHRYTSISISGTDMPRHFIDCFRIISHNVVLVTKFSEFHKENPTRRNSVSTFYFIFMWNSKCFGRHIAHRQEPKTALAASGFAYVEGCWTCSCWTLKASSNYTFNNPPRMQNQRLLVQF